MTDISNLLAARDLLLSAKRNLQLLDDEIAKLQTGRAALQLADDMSTEHRTAWFGAVDDNDGENGINVSTTATAFGFGNPFTGTIRVQEDAAFVVTAILVAGQRPVDVVGNEFMESMLLLPAIFASLKDGNTGRNLTPGVSVGPVSNDRGAVPLSTLSSFRAGLGANYKNSMFSEFTVPRAGTVKVTLWNMEQSQTDIRIFVSLLGYKAYGA